MNIHLYDHSNNRYSLHASDLRTNSSLTVYDDDFSFLLKLARKMGRWQIVDNVKLVRIAQSK